MYKTNPTENASWHQRTTSNQTTSILKYAPPWQFWIIPIIYKVSSSFSNTHRQVASVPEVNHVNEICYEQQFEVWRSGGQIQRCMRLVVFDAKCKLWCTNIWIMFYLCTVTFILEALCRRASYCMHSVGMLALRCSNLLIAGKTKLKMEYTSLKMDGSLTPEQRFYL